MNYPMQELAIIAPILFIVLMVAFPLIGVFAGWKRAAFWGGGNLLFYIIGLVVWTFAGTAIGGAIAPLIESIMEGTGIQADLSATAAALAAPVFFILVFLVGNLILLINYYAWFKRVAKLKKADKDPNPTTKSKVINHVFGGIGLPLLMLPSSIALTQATFMATTSANTRKGNDFVSNLYDGLMKINDSVNWFSYYNMHAGNDFDAAFAAIDMMSGEASVQYGTSTISGTPIVVVEQLFTQGFTDISNVIQEETSIEKIAPKVNNFTEAWNVLTSDENMQTNIQSLLSSDQATNLVEQVVETLIPGGKKVDITDSNIGPYVQTFENVVKEYKEGESITPIIPIPTTPESFENMEKAIHKMFDTEDLKDPDNKQALDDCLNTLLQLVLDPSL